MARHPRSHETSSTLLLRTLNPVAPSYKLSIEEKQLTSHVNFMFWLCSSSQTKKIIGRITSNIPADIINTIFFPPKVKLPRSRLKKWNGRLPSLTATLLDYQCHVTYAIIDHYNRYVTNQSVYSNHMDVWQASLVQLTAVVIKSTDLLKKTILISRR
jgi:hypothetical protein